jgi:hypothetical protein
MDLIGYRKTSGRSFAHLARLVGVHRHSLSEIAAGRRRPSWRLAGRIELETGGLVERAQWFPPVSDPSSKPLEPTAPGARGEIYPPMSARDSTRNGLDSAVNTLRDDTDRDQTNDATRHSVTTEPAP